jgi:nucleoid DNA-binding protein
MRKKSLWCLGGLLAALIVGTTLAQEEPAVPLAVKPRPKEKPRAVDLKARLAAETELEEEAVEKLLRALGPAIRDQLAAGQIVDLPGLGRFRVVRIAEHNDLINGRPTTVPASNYVEFLPEGDVVSAANAPTARPAETVPAFQYNPLPDRVPTRKVPNTRVPATRTR